MDFSTLGLELPLQNGERVVWTGQPGQGVRFRRADRSAIPFTLLWFGFFIFWEAWAIRTGRWGFILWGIPFLLIGAQVSVGRFLSDARRRARTTYVLTDRRLLVALGGKSPSVSTFSLRTIPAITLVESKAGSGDIVLDFSDARHVAVGGLRPKGSLAPTMLEFLPDARHVYNLICEAQRQAV
jgi:Bacterial PH domain